MSADRSTRLLDVDAFDEAADDALGDLRLDLAEIGALAAVDVRRTRHRRLVTLVAVAAVVLLALLGLPAVLGRAPAPVPAGPPPASPAVLPSTFAVDAGDAPLLVEGGKVRSRRVSAVFVGTDGIPAAADAQTGRVLRLPGVLDAQSLTVSPDGTRVGVLDPAAHGGVPRFVTVDLRSGRVVTTTDDALLLGGGCALLDAAGQAACPAANGGGVVVATTNGGPTAARTVATPSTDGLVVAAGGTSVLLPSLLSSSLGATAATHVVDVRDDAVVELAPAGSTGTAPALAADGTWWRVAAVPDDPSRLRLEHRVPTTLENVSGFEWAAGPVLEGDSGPWTSGVATVAVGRTSALLEGTAGWAGLWRADLATGRVTAVGSGGRASGPFALAAQVVGDSTAVDPPSSGWPAGLRSAVTGSGPGGMPWLVLALVVVVAGWVVVGRVQAWRRAGRPSSWVLGTAGILVLVGAQVFLPRLPAGPDVVPASAAVSSRAVVVPARLSVPTADPLPATDGRGGVRAQRLSLAAVVLRHGRSVALGVDAGSGAIVRLPAAPGSDDSALTSPLPYSVRLSPDGRSALVVTGTPEGVVGVLSDLATGRTWTVPLADAAAEASVVAARVAVADGGDVLAVRADGRAVERLDPATGGARWTAPLSDDTLTSPFALATAGPLVVTGSAPDGSGRAWSVTLDGLVTVLPAPGGAPVFGTTTSAAVAPDGTLWLGASWQASGPTGSDTGAAPRLARLASGAKAWGTPLPVVERTCAGCDLRSVEGGREPVAVVGGRLATAVVFGSPLTAVELVDPATGEVSPWVEFADDARVSDVALASGLLAQADPVQVVETRDWRAAVASRWTSVAIVVLALGGAFCARAVRRAAARRRRAHDPA